RPVERVQGGEPVVPGLTEPFGVAVHDGIVYWTDHDGVKAATADGGSSVFTINMQATPEWLATDDSGVFWTHFYTTCLGQSSLAGLSLSELGDKDCNGMCDGKVALDHGYVYSVREPPCKGPPCVNCVFRVAKDGGPTDVLVQNQDGIIAVA